MESWSSVTAKLYERVVNLETGAVFPHDLNNADYRQYLKWLEEGNTPEPADTPEQA